MRIEELYVLQSGFVTPVVKCLALPQYKERDLDNIIIKPYKKPLARYYYSPEITQLYKRFIFDSRVLHDFDFRESLLKAFLDVISGVSFKRWVYYQAQSNRLSTSAKAFLLDTLRFIATGKRVTRIDNWTSLVEISDDHIHHPTLQQELEVWFGERQDSEVHGTVPPGVSEALVAWLSHPAGFEDFMISAGLIFAEHKNVKIT